jgi:hypothetical protein
MVGGVPGVPRSPGGGFAPGQPAPRGRGGGVGEGVKLEKRR